MPDADKAKEKPNAVNILVASQPGKISLDETIDLGNDQDVSVNVFVKLGDETCKVNICRPSREYPESTQKPIPGVYRGLRVKCTHTQSYEKSGGYKIPKVVDSKKFYLVGVPVKAISDTEYSKEGSQVAALRELNYRLGAFTCAFPIMPISCSCGTHIPSKFDKFSCRDLQKLFRNLSALINL